MKVRIFEIYDISELEDKINEFIQDKKVLFVKQSVAISPSDYVLNISIWYEEVNNEK